MLIVRYAKYGKIFDLEVSSDTAHSVLRNLKRKYKHADLIMIDAKGTEYCVC